MIKPSFEIEVLGRVADLAPSSRKINAGPSLEYGKLAHGMIPAIVRAPKGRLGNVWSAGEDGSRPFLMTDGGDDDGETWSRPRLLVNAHDDKRLPLPLRLDNFTINRSSAQMGIGRRRWIWRVAVPDSIVVSSRISTRRAACTPSPRRIAACHGGVVDAPFHNVFPAVRSTCPPSGPMSLFGCGSGRTMGRWNLFPPMATITQKGATGRL